MMTFGRILPIVAERAVTPAQAVDLNKSKLVGAGASGAFTQQDRPAEAPEVALRDEALNTQETLHIQPVVPRLGMALAIKSYAAEAPQEPKIAVIS
ncbi:MAG: hypothetical protein EBQ80_03185 [Proteobacteria bacterium]|nr:hypothetical protein [Pseudomonadota bacterium]